MEKKQVGIWIRVSTEDQAQGESPEHHLKRAEAYAAAKDWEVVTVYHLEGVSGKSVLDHKEAIRMMREVRSGKIQGLIFSKLARLARSTKQLLEFSEFFRQYNADLISLQESIDTSSPAGRLFYTLIAAMAQWEREEIADRVKASVPIRAQMGKSLGGFAPFGYSWENKQLVLNEDEAAIRKHAFELFLQYKRKKTVANKLNELGFRTRKGKRFTDTTIGRILLDPISKGLRRVNYTQSMGKDKQWILKPEEEWVFVQVPAIVSKEVWEEANAILKEQTQKRKRKAKLPAHLFSGYIECSCGGKMYVPSNSPKYTCKKCRSKIPESDMEAIFHKRLKRFLTSEEETRRAMEDLVRIIEEREELIEERKSSAAKLKQQLDSLVELYQEGQIPKAGFKDHYQPIYNQLQQVNEAIPLLEGEVDHLINSIQSADSVFHEARTLHDKWKESSFEEKRQIIEEILEGIVISDTEMHIRLKNIQSLSSFQTNDTLATHPKGCVANLPNHILTAKRPESLKAGIPQVANPRKRRCPPGRGTLGYYFWKRRAELELSPKAAAAVLGVSRNAYTNWEHNQFHPQISCFPRIIQFLGFDPLEEDEKNLANRLRGYRRRHGLSKEKLAQVIGVHEETLLEWERGKQPRRHLLKAKLRDLNLM